MNNPGILRVLTRTKMRKTIAIILSVAALGLNGWAENIAPDLQSTVDELKDKLAKLEAKLAELDEAKTASASKPDPAVVVIPQDRVDFAKSVQGIFEARCIDCHGSKKQKGDLRLDKKETALGEVIQPGNSGESELAKLISLPADHEDIMPNKGEPLTKDQIATIKQWIDEGANWPDGLVLVSAKDRAGAKAVSREELLTEVWGYNAGVTTHTLETHIYRLRQKIEPEPGQARLLLTDAGGYRLQP